jgi:hypothetical protein
MWHEEDLTDPSLEWHGDWWHRRVGIRIPIFVDDQRGPYEMASRNVFRSFLGTTLRRLHAPDYMVQPSAAAALFERRQ